MYRKLLFFILVISLGTIFMGHDGCDGGYKPPEQEKETSQVVPYLIPVEPDSIPEGTRYFTTHDTKPDTTSDFEAQCVYFDCFYLEVDTSQMEAEKEVDICYTATQDYIKVILKITLEGSSKPVLSEDLGFVGKKDGKRCYSWDISKVELGTYIALFLTEKEEPISDPLKIKIKG